MRPLLMWCGYQELSKEEIEKGWYNINRWELFGSKLGLEMAKKSSTQTPKEWREGIEGWSGEGGLRKEQRISRREAESLLELLPESLGWWKEGKIELC